MDSVMPFEYKIRGIAVIFMAVLILFDRDKIISDLLCYLPNPK